MSDIQDKIAALPPIPEASSYANSFFALEARHAIALRTKAERDLALEVLRGVIDSPRHMPLREQERLGTECPKCRAIVDARALLAACGGESERQEV